MQKLIKNIVQKLIAWIRYANKEINKEKTDEEKANEKKADDEEWEAKSPTSQLIYLLYLALLLWFTWYLLHLLPDDGVGLNVKLKKLINLFF